MRKRVKRLWAITSIILILLLVGSIAYANGYKLKINEEITNIEDKQMQTHILAESIRDLKLDNEDEVIAGLKQTWHELENHKASLQKKLDKLVYLGVFESSAYCGENYHHTCNNGNAKSTATGATPTAKRTVAIDPKVVPLGATVIINGNEYVNGNEYIAEDTGGAIKGKKVDIFFDTHAEALQYGRRKVDVYIIKP